MTAEQRELLVQWLQNLANRPTMCIGRSDPDAVHSCLLGLNVAIDILDGSGINRNSIRYEVMESRGWVPLPFEVFCEKMAKRNMTRAEMIAELAGIEIEVLERMAGLGAKPTEPKGNRPKQD